MRDAERKLETDRIAVDRIERTLRSWRLTESEIAKIRADAEKKTDRGQTDHNATLDTTWGEVDVRAPFDGTILERNATAGDTIDTDLDLFKIADLSRLAVSANAPAERASELNALAPEQRWWSIDLWPGPDREPIAGYFDTVGEIIDPAQRTVSIMGTVDNKAGMLRAGQMITATIGQLGASGHQVAFPVSALVPVVGTGSDGAKVWVEIDAAKPSFDWRPAHVARQMAGTVICELSPQEANDVTNPLRVGAQVVVWGKADPPDKK
jgi:membrane fusion protein, heavy metal efflux system